MTFRVTQIYITLRFCTVTRLQVRRKDGTFRTSPSVRQQYHTDQAAGITINKYHAIKTSPSVDRRFTWRSVFTSQPAPLLLREICCEVEGIRVRIATRDGRSWDQMPAGRVGCPWPSSLLSNRYLVFTWGKSAGSGAYCPILQPEWLAAISPPPSTTAQSRHGEEGHLSLLLGRRVGENFTAWTLACPCLDFNPVSSVHQPVDFSLHSLSYNDSNNRVSTEG